MKPTRRLAHASLTAMALASCATERRAPPPASVVRPQVPPPSAAPLAPAAFVATAASIDLFVVRACELAMTRARDPRIGALAIELRDGHRGLAAQLSWAGRRVGALPAAKLLPREQQRLAWLEGEASFGAAFVRQMKLSHRQSLALHSAFAARGISPTLRPVAANAERVEHAHLALLESR